MTTPAIPEVLLTPNESARAAILVLAANMESAAEDYRSARAFKAARNRVAVAESLREILRHTDPETLRRGTNNLQYLDGLTLAVEGLRDGESTKKDFLKTAARLRKRYGDA